MVTMFYGAFIWKFLQFVFILFCGASPTAKLNLIFLKFIKFWYENVRYKTLPMVTIFYGALIGKFYKCVLILFRGASPTAKLNLIILKYLRNFGTKTLGTKTLPVVTMHYSAYLKVIPMCFDLKLPASLTRSSFCKS